MKTRGERRAIKIKKWKSKLRKLWFSNVLWERISLVKSNRINYFDEPKAESWKDFEKDRWGVMNKNTGTILRDNKRLDIKEEHKRNLENRKLSKEDIEEVNECLRVMDNPYDFENYCCNCDHFPGDNFYEKREYYGECPFKKKFLDGIFTGDTEWKKIGCKNFWD